MTHTTTPHTQTAAQHLITLGQWIDSRQWCPATGGNFSHRLSETRVLITGSGCHKGQLTPTDLLEVDLHGNRCSGTRQPSAETLLHTALYTLDPRIKVVLHTHSITSTVLSRRTNADWLTLTGYEMQKALDGNTSHQDTIRIAILDNDQDMAGLAKTLQTRWAQQPLHWGFLVRGHGLYSWGNTVETARRHLEGLEFLFDCALIETQMTGVYT